MTQLYHEAKLKISTPPLANIESAHILFYFPSFVRGTQIPFNGIFDFLFITLVHKKLLNKIL